MSGEGNLRFDPVHLASEDPKLETRNPELSHE